MTKMSSIYLLPFDEQRVSHQIAQNIESVLEKHGETSGERAPAEIDAIISELRARNRNLWARLDKKVS